MNAVAASAGGRESEWLERLRAVKVGMATLVYLGAAMIPSLLLLLACAPSGPLPEHRLVMGGDVMLGRRFNLALADAEKRARVFEAIAPALVAADLAVVNAEGVISAGGTPWDKGEPRPHQHHALPEAVDVLREAGVDVVTMGNNHAGDYGPAALVEARDRLQAAGIDVAGAGVDQAEAGSPVYRRVGDVTVAIVGADLTMAAKHAATAERGGVFHLPGADPRKRDRVVEALLAIEEEARRHAHVVVFSPHWGDNFETAPTEHTRELAHALVDGGYDAILGHSAHVFQGVELYRGRPIAYDVGNLVADYGGGDPAHLALLADLSFTREGVTSLSMRPLFLETNRTVWAEGERQELILTDLVERSRALGTTLTVADGVASVRCTPAGGPTPPEPAPPTRERPPEVRVAATELVLDEVPASARPADVVWEELGLRLAGTELLMERLRIPKAGQLVRLYFTADRPLPADLMIRIASDDGYPDPQDDHYPGDWMWPADRWPPGKVLQDRYLARMVGTPEGTITFRAGITVGGRVVPPTRSDRPSEGGLVELGRATYEADAPGMFEVFAADPRSRLW